MASLALRGLPHHALLHGLPHHAIEHQQQGRGRDERDQHRPVSCDALHGQTASALKPVSMATPDGGPPLVRDLLSQATQWTVLFAERG